MSLRIEKQNVQGTGAPLGLSSTQCEYTDCVVFSNAWFAKFSQYSTTDWFSKSCAYSQSCVTTLDPHLALTHLIDVLPLPDELLPLPAREHAELRADEADLACAAPRDGGRA